MQLHMPKAQRATPRRSITQESTAMTQMVDTRLGSLAVRVRGDGPVAVLWHSLFVDDRTWKRVEEHLARERRLVIITGPGHGASPDPRRRYNLDECAGAATDVLASLGVDQPVDWIGNAWGGHVGVVFAARWPERCRTLVTLGTPIQSYNCPNACRSGSSCRRTSVWAGGLHRYRRTRRAAVTHDPGA